MDIEGYCLRLDCCGCLETLGRGPGEYMEADKASELQQAIQYEEAFVVVDYCRTYYEAVRPAEEVSILSLCPDCGTCDTSFGRFVLNSFINSWNSPRSSASKRLVLTRLSLLYLPLDTLDAFLSTCDFLCQFLLWPPVPGDTAPVGAA